MSTEKDGTGRTYAEIWGEAIHSNRHLRVLSMGRAEALAYETVEAQADPLDPTTKYFLNRFIDDYYSRRRATVEQAWARGLPLFDYRSSQRSLPGRRAGTSPCSPREPPERNCRSSAWSCGFRPIRREPHGATADFDLVRLENAVETSRERWTLSMQFIFLETIPPEMMIFNPMGIIITYLRGDRALVTGG